MLAVSAVRRYLLQPIFFLHLTIILTSKLQKLNFAVSPRPVTTHDQFPRLAD